MQRQWSGILHNHISDVWEGLALWIDAACKRAHNKFTPDDIRKALEERRSQLWVSGGDNGIDGAGITEIIVYPQKKYGRVTLGMGHEPKDISGFIELFEDWAKAQGCDGVEAVTRPGFEKAFREAGWKITHVIVEREF